MASIDGIELYQTQEVSDELNEAERRFAKTIVRTIPNIGTLDNRTAEIEQIAISLFLLRYVKLNGDEDIDYLERVVKVLGFRIGMAINDITPFDYGSFSKLFLDVARLRIFMHRTSAPDVELMLNGYKHILPAYVTEALDNEMINIKRTLGRLVKNY